jgi:hypothetical protein
VDLWHQDLTEPEVAILEGMHRYVLQHAEDLNVYWSGNEKARVAARRSFH